VKTLSTTSMLNKLGKLYHVPVYETGVGFKYVAPKMVETDAMIGGEESVDTPSKECA
jgi:phosphomannomutase